MHEYVKWLVTYAVGFDRYYFGVREGAWVVFLGTAILLQVLPE